MNRLREWWATRRHGRMTRDACVECGEQLREKERTEVLHGGDFSTEFGGFSGLIATYCPEHAPEGVPA